MSHVVHGGVVALGVVAAMTAASGGRVAAQSSALPNPYQSILDWAKLPQGRTWGQMAALDIDSHGNIEHDAESRVHAWPSNRKRQRRVGHGVHSPSPPGSRLPGGRRRGD